MSDETPDKRTRRPGPAPADGPPPADAPGAEDADAALRRLESLGASGAAGRPRDPDSLPPSPAVDSFGASPPSSSQRPMGSSRKTSRAPRPHPAGSRNSRAIARIAAPVVFLVAVIALIGIVVNSGVLGDGAPSPTPTVTSTKAAHATKKYVVHSGDSLSSIAVRFNTSTAELLQLNPDLNGNSTLSVGARIVVPRQ